MRAPTTAACCTEGALGATRTSTASVGATRTPSGARPIWPFQALPAVRGTWCTLDSNAGCDAVLHQYSTIWCNMELVFTGAVDAIIAPGGGWQEAGWVLTAKLINSFNPDYHHQHQHQQWNMCGFKWWRVSSHHLNPYYVPDKGWSGAQMLQGNLFFKESRGPLLDVIFELCWRCAVWNDVQSWRQQSIPN